MDHWPQRGDAIDHFLVVDRIGEGGMGVVVAAYDPDLDRKVAIKLLRARDDEEAHDQAVARLFREAKAMARLSHANVATVHEVGLVEDRVFIAMEYVPGVDGREWLRAGGRTNHEILAIFIAAGRGLAAAHAADIVHRDFKPSNVMVGEDGRVCVVDFGLARSPTGAPTDARSNVDAPSHDAGDLTRTGAMVGTPAYMAPEQQLGQAIDARSDQFSFCVALYEALARVHPFPGDTPLEISNAIVDGRRTAPCARVPGWLRPILERGMRPARNERYPDMDTLLHELERDPRARRTRLAGWATALVVTLAAAVGGWHILDSRLQPCAAAAAATAQMWDSARATSLQTAFIATARPNASATAEAVSRRLGDLVGAWGAMRRDTCEATLVRGEQSQQLMDLRIECLERRRVVLDELTRTFVEHATGDVVDRAVEAVAGLSLEACADTKGLLAVVQPPDEPLLRARVTELRQNLDEIDAHYRAGAYAQSLADIAPVAAAAARTEFPPLQAEAQLQLARLQDSAAEYEAAEAALRSAAENAARGRHDRVAAEAWTSLADVVSKRARHDQALTLVPVAASWLDRAGAGAELRARFHDVVGLVHRRTGKYELAVEEHQRALAIAEEALGKAHLETLRARNHLGLAEWRRGDSDRALELFRENLDIEEASLPEGHPMVVNALNNIGLVHYRRGDHGPAEKTLRRALELGESALGEDHPGLCPVLDNLGNLARRQRDSKGALAHLERSLAIRERVVGPDHPETTKPLEGIAAVLWIDGKPADAVAYYERVVAIHEQTLGAEHPRLAESLNNLGGALAAADLLPRGLPHIERALAIRQKNLGPEHPAVAWTLTDLGNFYQQLGRAAEAIPLLERALTIRSRDGVDPMDLADTRFHLARALWSDRGQRKRAMQLARDARAGYTQVGKRASGELAATSKWLAERRR